MKVKDMTRGNPISLIIKFALPLFIGNIFQQIYSIVDTIIAGYKFGDRAIAAIGATAAIYGLLINFAVGLNNGFAIVVSRYFGAKDYKNLKSSIFGMFVLNLSITFAVTLVSVLGIDVILHIMNIPLDIYDLAKSYILIILLGMVITISYNMASSVMRAVGNSTTPLYFLIIACVLNIILDYVFVFTFDFGVKGTAYATIISQAVAAILSVIYILKHYRDILPKKQDFKLSRDLQRELLENGFAMSLMYCFVDIGTVIFQRAINTLGASLITAHVTARRIIGILSMPIGSVASANATFVSQNFGAKKYERIKKSLLKVNALVVIYSIISCIFIVLFGKRIVVFLTNTSSEYIIDKSFINMLCHFICTPFVGVLLVLRTTLQSLNIKTVPIISSTLELLIKIVCGLFLVYRFGYIVVCLTEPIIWIVCMLYLTIYFIYKKPLEKLIKNTVVIN